MQRAAGCVIGVDYPAPIVDHAAAMSANMARMKLAYAAARGEGGGASAVAGAGAGEAAAPAAKKAKR